MTALVPVKPHIIEDISYSKDFIQCSCGERITDIYDGTSWEAHGGKVLRAWPGDESLPLATADHIEEVRRQVEDEEREVQDA